MFDFDICQVVGACRQTRSFSCRSKALKESTARASLTSSTFGAPAATASSNVAKKVSSLPPIVPSASVSMTSLRRGSIKYQHQPLLGDINGVTRFGLWTLLLQAFFNNIRVASRDLISYSRVASSLPLSGHLPYLLFSLIESGPLISDRFADGFRCAEVDESIQTKSANQEIASPPV